MRDSLRLVTVRCREGVRGNVVVTDGEYCFDTVMDLLVPGELLGEAVTLEAVARTVGEAPLSDNVTDGVVSCVGEDR